MICAHRYVPVPRYKGASGREKVDQCQWRITQHVWIQLDVACIPSSWLLPPTAQSWDHWFSDAHPSVKVPESVLRQEGITEFKHLPQPPIPVGLGTLGLQQTPRFPSWFHCAWWAVPWRGADQPLSSPGASEKARLHQHRKGLLCGSLPLILRG